ncbi:MAG: hypothetical protein AAGF94_07585 [Pseudomonadota bacterium]
MGSLSDFDASTVDELFDKIVEQVKGVASKWYNANRDVVEGYFKSLAQASFQTQVSLKSGRIDKEVADQALRMQQAALRQTIRYTEFMTFVLAQQVVDAAFKVIGTAVKNYTGVNFFPELSQV